MTSSGCTKRGSVSTRPSEAVARPFIAGSHTLPSSAGGCAFGCSSSTTVRSQPCTVSGSGAFDSFYQSGRDPELQRESLGMVLLAHAIRSASDDGVHEFALLRGQEPYKHRFATDDRGLDSVCVVRGRAAAAALALIQAVRSCPAARKVLRGPLEI